MSAPLLCYVSAHARRRLQQRGIRLEWVCKALANPDARFADAEDPEVTHVRKRIHAAGDKVLRVLYNHKRTPWRVVTAFFERKRGRRR